MSRPAPVSAYNSLGAVPLRYSWLVPWNYAGTTDGPAYISPSAGINYTRPCNNRLPVLPHIPFWRFPVFPGIFFQTQKLFPGLVPGVAGNLSGNGSFPVPVTASLCSRYGLVHCPCCLLNNAVHGQDIPGAPLHNYKR